MAKNILSQELFEKYLNDRDFIIFKTTKKDFLNSIPKSLTISDIFNNHMYSLEQRVIETSDSPYIHIRVNNIQQQYLNSHPLWTLTKIQYFQTHMLSEYYSPITVSINERHTALRYHPGIWRMAMLHTQQNTLKMTKCIDTTQPFASKLLGYFKSHELRSARSLTWNEFYKFMNFAKFPGEIYIQDDIAGLNFATNRSKCYEYTGKFDLAYNKNERTFFFNHRPLVRWKNGFWHIL